MNAHDWAARLKTIFEKGAKDYRSGKQGADRFFGSRDLEFLASIGCTAQELYDFIEDHVKYGEPSFETTLLITAVRRDYFHLVQHCQPSRNVVSMDDLPPKTAEIDGIAWLPRLIVKAQVKLKGEMPPDLMYGCGGDRPFAEKMHIDLADFLRVVWATGGEERAIVHYVKTSAEKGHPHGFRTLPELLAQ